MTFGSWEVLFESKSRRVDLYEWRNDFSDKRKEGTKDPVIHTNTAERNDDKRMTRQ